MPSTKLRVVCISDTHNHAPGEGYTLPKGDILVHAGDLTNQGTHHELERAAEWLRKAEFDVKVVVGGNHDLALDPSFAPERESGRTGASGRSGDARRLLESIEGVTYLQHSGAEIALPGHNATLNVFGSPYSPASSTETWAFQYPPSQADDLWSAIPLSTELLITHTPPAGHCNSSQHWTHGGCPSLRRALWNVKPALHICGHCHEGRGAQVVCWSPETPGAADSVRVWQDETAGTKKQALLDLTGRRGGRKLAVGRETAVVNASVMGRSWGQGGKVFNKPIVVDVDLPIQEEEG